jgi:uncharacterized protein (TIGR00106 family)
MNLEISIVPVSQDENTAKYMAEVVKIVEDSGLEYKYTPMSVMLSGERESTMEVAKKCHEKVMSMTDRAMTKMRFDEAKNHSNGFDSEIRAVEKILGKKVKK